MRLPVHYFVEQIALVRGVLVHKVKRLVFFHDDERAQRAADVFKARRAHGLLGSPRGGRAFWASVRLMAGRKVRGLLVSQRSGRVWSALAGRNCAWACDAQVLRPLGDAGRSSRSVGWKRAAWPRLRGRLA